MRYAVKGRYNKRSRLFVVHAENPEQASRLAVDQIVNQHRLAKGYAGEVWQRGKVTLIDDNDVVYPVQVPPYLRSL